MKTTTQAALHAATARVTKNKSHNQSSIPISCTGQHARHHARIASQYETPMTDGAPTAWYPQTQEVAPNSIGAEQDGQFIPAFSDTKTPAL